MLLPPSYFLSGVHCVSLNNNPQQFPVICAKINLLWSFRLLILHFFDLLFMFFVYLFLALFLIFLAAFVSHCLLLSYCHLLDVWGVAAL
jgi:hypothetical protein